MNKNKIRNAGKIFGYMCAGIGVLMILFTMPLIENETKDFPINTWAVILEGIGLVLYLYGAWRSGFGRQ